MSLSNVVLICPNSGGPERIENEGGWPPLGLVYMGTMLERSGHRAKIIDNAGSRLPDEELISRVKAENPDIVGISALSPTFRRTITLASKIKDACPDSKVVLWNYHATFEYERILRKCDFVDFGAWRG